MLQGINNKNLKLMYIFFILLSLFNFSYSKEKVDSAPYLYKKGEILVKFKTTNIKTQTIHNRIHANVLKRFKHLNIELIKLPAGLTVQDAIRFYSSDPDVEFVEPNYFVKKAVYPNDPYFDNQWGLNNIGQIVNNIKGTEGADISAPEAWNLSTGSKDVIVAVLDTGVDYNHEDLADNIFRNEAECNGQPNVDDDSNGYVDDCIGWNFVNNNNDPMDDDVDSHGTHVAGIIGAVGNNGIGITGVNWHVKILPVKVLDSNGGGDIATIIEGIEYAVNMGAKVINASYTYPQSCIYILPLQGDKEAIEFAKENGVLFIAAAGNYGCNNDQTPFYPASHPLNNIISVTATDQNDEMPYWANYGIDSVYVAAPGDNIYSTIKGGYEFLSGTSMATPFVSGLAALIYSSHPEYTYLETREVILSSADKLFSLENKIASKGRINAYQALLLNLNSLIPFKPTHIKATLSSDKKQISLSWIDNSSVEIYYLVERKSDTENNYITISNLPENTTSYIDTSISSGKTYFYRIKACNENGCSVSKEVSISVPATPTQYILTIEKNGTGSGTVTSSPSGIDCGTTCSASYNAGITVTLTASAATNSTFAGWSGDCSGCNGTSCDITMDTDKTCTATFNAVESNAKNGTSGGGCSFAPKSLNLDILILFLTILILKILFKFFYFKIVNINSKN